MRSKEFLKIANEFRDGFVRGIKKAFHIHKPSEHLNQAWQSKPEIKPDMKTPAQEIADTLNRAAQEYGEAGEQARALIRLLSDFSDCMSMGRFVREQTNNWKKMHGQPMKRRTLQERRRKSK